MTALGENCSQHISVVKDAFSWEKEVWATQKGHEEGSLLRSAVQSSVAETIQGVKENKKKVVGD